MIAEAYRVQGRWVRRELTLGERRFSTRIEDISALEDAAPGWARWWLSYLRGSRPEFEEAPSGNLSIVDLFCGCGGFTLGAREAARAAGLRLFVRIALDTDREALGVYAANLFPRETVCADASTAVDWKVIGWAESARFAYPPEPTHSAIRAAIRCVDIVIAGPPCEGYSNLNNRTRRSDPRHLLFLDAIALGVGLHSKAIVLENVPDIVNDRSRVVETAEALLRNSDYRTTRHVLACDELGFPQTRKRLFLIASKYEVIPLNLVAEALAREPMTLHWAIGDLVGRVNDPIMDSPAELSPDNRRRIDYLFENNLYDLPDHMRPQCHRNGHSYPAVYGRLRWDRPAGTITTGFMTPGRGRFIHPSERRTLTPREAARLQGFPDWFHFHRRGREVSRKALGKFIGDAVPPVLGYAAVLAVLPGLIDRI